MKEKANEQAIIKKAINMMKEVKVKDSYDWMTDWMYYDGFDANADRLMRNFHKTIGALEDTQLREVLSDLWSANYEFHLRLNEDSPRVYHSQAEVDEAIRKAKRNARIANRPMPKMQYYLLDFDETEQELETMAKNGTRSYRELLAQLMEKYAVRTV